MPDLAAHHEAVVEKYLFILKLLKTKMGKISSVKYFSHGYGDGNPMGGRILMVEYLSFHDYEEFQEALAKRDDYQGFQAAWSKLILPSTLKSSIWFDRSRSSWFSGQGTEVGPGI